MNFDEEENEYNKTYISNPPFVNLNQLEENKEENLGIDTNMIVPFLSRK